MANKTNIGEAILILGSIMFMMTPGIRWWGIVGLLILIGLSIGTWEFVHHSKELNQLVTAQIEEIQTRTKMLKAQISLFAAQVALYMKGIKPQ